MTLPFWKIILDEREKLKDQVQSLSQCLLEAELRAHLLEQELKETKAELKITLINRHLPSSPAKSL